MNKHHLQTPAFLINSLIDNGAKEDIDSIADKCLDRTLFDYLGDKYEDEELKVFARREEAEVFLEDFFHTFTDSDYRRKFGVTNNGLNLLVAAFINSTF
ncbi:hypothetical protein [Priestia megaterium]|uniref:hypothetical protein n=1 Tax=Priestia megaterium TaxID=1404 RepID=UPI003D2E948F